MNETATIINRSKNLKLRKPLIIKILAILVGGSIICCLGLFIIEIFPRFIIIDFPPPDFAKRAEYGGGWGTTIYSVQLEPMIPQILNSRVFVWRRQVDGVFDQTHGITSWQSIVTYFDYQFEQKGWEQTKAYTPCNRYMPEAIFLPPGQNGYVFYRPKGFKETMDFYGGNFICLAVWRGQNDTSFNVVFVTISQSPLDIIASFSQKAPSPETQVVNFSRSFLYESRCTGYIEADDSVLYPKAHPLTPLYHPICSSRTPLTGLEPANTPTAVI